MANIKTWLLSKSNQYNFYKNNYNQLKEENALLNEKVKNLEENINFSFNNQLRGSSGDLGKPKILEFILANFKKDCKILDIGFGAGVYGKLLKAFFYQNIDGVDVWSKNIKETGLNHIYDNIFIENVLDFDFDYYDLIIMGDVLEHIELEDSKKLLEKFINENKCSSIIVQVPYVYENEIAHYGNDAERHLQPTIDKEYMEKHFPYLNFYDLITIPAEESCLGRKTGKNTQCATYIWCNK